MCCGHRCPLHHTGFLPLALNDIVLADSGVGRFLVLFPHLRHRCPEWQIRSFALSLGDEIS